jgi:hypothetical protein
MAVNLAESNTQNARLSTGPRTPEGKVAASRNSIRHGVYSEAILVLGEEQADFDALRDGMAESLRPIGSLEEGLVDRLSRLWWRLERAGKAEKEALQAGAEYAQRQQQRRISEPSHVAFLTWTTNGCNHLERLGRYETQLEKSFFRILHELERLQARRQGLKVAVPLIVDVNVSMD